MEKINILMTTHNGRRFVARQIESILNQTYRDFRLIVSDDCSTDSTLKILEEYEKKDNRVEIYRQCENLGIVKNFEFLIGKVRSEYFMFSNQDDIWELDKVEKSIKKLEEGNYDLVYTDLMVVDIKLNEIASSYWSLKEFDYKVKKYNNFESLYLNNYICGNTMIVKSKWINEFLPLPKTSKYILHDYWISLIISQNGKLGYISEPTIKYRQHNKNSIGFRTKNEKLNSLDDVRELIIDEKLDHFNTFIKNENIFQNKKYKQLNIEALRYFEKLKNIKNFSLKGIGVFFKLYKYEPFNYKLKNIVILHIPILARQYFNRIMRKKKLEEDLKQQEELKLKKEKTTKNKETRKEKTAKDSKNVKTKKGALREQKVRNE